MEIKISSSLIKSFLDNGEPKNHCPRKIKATTIDKTHSEQKDVFTYGKYFEIACGIGTAYPNEPEPRIERGALTEKQKKEATEAGIPQSEFPYLGKILVDEQRILQQAESFKKMLPMYGGNTKRCQVILESEWKKTSEIKGGVTVVLTGVADFISPFYDPSPEVDIYYEEAVWDLKLTGNIYTSDKNNRFSWKFPSDKDHTQAKMYHLITGLPFVYAVFDFAPACNYMIFPVMLNSMHMNSLDEDIKHTLDYILQYETNGWNENSNYQDCQTCPLAYDCKKRVKIKPSVPIYPCY